MKVSMKKGVSYIEILVAVTIFIIGLVPMFNALGDAYKRTYQNKIYTKALEYNIQLREEIASTLPGKISEVDVETSGEDIEDLIKTRDESTVRKALTKVPVSGNTYVLSGGKVQSNIFYRELVVGEFQEEIFYDNDGNVITLEDKIYMIPVKIVTRNKNNDKILMETKFVIYFEKE